MKEVKFQIYTFLIIALAIQANANDVKKSHSRERKHIYPCGNKFYQYYLDDEPSEYGIKAGDYEPGKPAYVGIVDAFDVVISSRIQLSPPGIVHPNNFKYNFVNDSSKTWYLYKNPDHKYEWIDSKFSEETPFAIDFGSDSIGVKFFIARIKMSKNTIALGMAAPDNGQVYFLNSKGIATTVTKGFQVLTCKSCKPYKYIPTPKPTMALAPPTAETGCINNWVEYKNDDAPSKNGISAGTYDCGNTAYVGKGTYGNYMYPGRIQTVGNAGLYYVIEGKETFTTIGSYYLADNPKYTYYWIDYNGNYPTNTVFSKAKKFSYLMPIARAKINGHMQIGSILATQAVFPGDDKSAVRFKNFELLVCDPWPKYQCKQEWKKFDVNSKPSVDGFNIGAYKDDIISYIGRGTCKQINGCDYELGRIQIDPLNASGAYYLDDLTATEKFDKVTAEYLVKNPNYFYKWIPSRSGVKVENALELHKEGHRPFYIGVTQINDNVFVGKVRPGEGLYFIDINGKQKSTSSYNVLTCTSSEAGNDVYKEENDENWFGSFGCPVRKEWNFKQWRCVCRDEFKGIFTSNSAKWNEDTCSYSI